MVENWLLSRMHLALTLRRMPHKIAFSFSTKGDIHGASPSYVGRVAALVLPAGPACRGPAVEDRAEPFSLWAQKTYPEQTTITRLH